jgi:TPR repeat protein
MMQFAGLWSSERRRQIPGVPVSRRRDVRADRLRRIRTLALQVDANIANAVKRRNVWRLDNRVDTLVRAINTSKAAGEVLPPDLEKLLARLLRKLKRTRAKRVRKPYGFAQAAGNVGFGVSLAFSLFVALHIFDQAGLFDEIVSFLAEQAQSLQSSWATFEPAQMIARADKAPLETPSHATGNSPAEIAGAQPPTDAARSAPPGLGSSATIVEDNLPETIGNPALRAAATAGDPAAAYEVASRFADGRGVPQSHEEEARWLEHAANQGLAPAQFRLGGLYEKGVGVGKDLARARDLYLAAALKGNARAMHNLAVLYAEGVNGTADYETAAAWFHKAADHGIKDSQYNLAILCARGIGVQQDYAESYKWFVLAANQGDGDAAVKRDQVAAYLDRQTQEAARLAAQSWSPQPQPDDAVNVKTQAAWDTPAETPHPVKPKPRPAGSDTRTANAKSN